MLDTTPALADMASQIRESRVADGLTLQQLATRSGVAASTIHKVESRQMIPTVSVLLKIAKGLGCRPEELIRDAVESGSREEGSDATELPATPRLSPTPPSQASQVSKTALGSNFCVWQVNLEAGKLLPTLDLSPDQRAILLVERGMLDILADGKHLQMNAGDCIEVEGTRIQSHTHQVLPTRLTLIATQSGNLDQHLGQPRRSSPSIL